ncbi:MAG: hypothetical protein WAK35_04130, partial [Xanthobacteraceae bacterium]
MSAAGKRPRGINAGLAWLIGPLRKGIDAAAAGLRWAFGDVGPAHSANESIRRHIIAGSLLVGFL